MPKVAINFGTPQQKWLETISIAEAKQYMLEGHFAPGSMLPKVEAAVKFAASRPGRKAIITSLEMAYEGVTGKNGTIITQDI